MQQFTNAINAKTVKRHAETYQSACFHEEKHRATPVGGAAKRVLDLVICVIAAIILSPLLIGVALLIWKNDPGPVFYGHLRIGFDGKPFRCWKYRSMVVGGDAVLARHLNENPEARAEWEETQKLRDDPRITPIGHVIRKLSIDELPQLYNVLVGEMSIVGPRPVVASELVRYGASAKSYKQARPGLTGPWQVSGRSDTSYVRRIAFDRAYIRRWSMLGDAVIILRTVPAVIFSRGSC